MIGTGIEAFINLGGGGTAIAKEIKPIDGAAYVLQAVDKDFILQSSSSLKITIPKDLPFGQYEGKQLGAGAIAFDTVEGVTLNMAAGQTGSTTGQFTHFKLDYTAPNTYMLYDLDMPDATASKKGGMRLGGDLAGTADLPRVPTKLNKGANVEYESLNDTSEIYSPGFFSRVGAMFRSPNFIWNEALKKLTIVGSQAIWEAYSAVTDGNMGIKALTAAKEAFKLFDVIGNFITVGTEDGKRVTRVFTAFRFVNGSSYNETEYKAVQCLGLVSTLIKSIQVPLNSVLTVDVTNISVMNIDKSHIIGYAQFSFKNNGGAVTDISRDEMRYNRQFSSITNNYVINTTTRIDATVAGTVANINFVNTLDKLTNVHCEIKFTVTLIPEL